MVDGFHCSLLLKKETFVFALRLTVVILAAVVGTISVAVAFDWFGCILAHIKVQLVQRPIHKAS